jgi:CubicO group peptidase (beta-lactamase class C family)
VAALAGGADPADLYAGYLAQMQARIFDPIGLVNTTFDFDRVAASPDRATPHGLTLGGDLVPLPLSDEAVVRPVAPAGATWSTAQDLARYLLTALNRGVTPEGRRVVSAENLGKTWEPQVAVSAETSYGLGWFVETYKGLQLLHHGGNTAGFTADLALLPEAGVGIVVLTNARRSNAFTEAVRYRLVELLYDQLAEHDAQAMFTLEATRRATQEAVAGLGVAVDPTDVAPYLGTFTNAALGDISLNLVEEGLLLDAGEFTSELRPATDQAGRLRYLMYDPPLTGTAFEFRVDDDGAPVVVLVTATDTYAFVRRG